jgi:hypothetical protein
LRSAHGDGPGEDQRDFNEEHSRPFRSLNWMVSLRCYLWRNDMPVLSKIMNDDEDNFYIVPVEKERIFDAIMYKDAEDWDMEEQALIEEWAIDGDYESVVFMWPAEAN